MIPDGWLKASMVLPGVSAASVEALAEQVAELMARTAGVAPEEVRTVLLEAMRGDGFSLGGGVAIPHTAMDKLSETVVCLVTLREPLPVKTIDGKAPDIFLFILAKPDPHSHLLLLAHLARLAQSRTFLDGLRQAQTPQELVDLVHAAEMRQQALPALARSSQIMSTVTATTTYALFFVSIGGEKAVDALLIDLVDQGFGDACVLEAQSLHEATAREVPLFAGFRDLFGDPGGRRIIVLEAAADHTDAIIGAVKRISQEHRASDAQVSVVPLQTRWIVPRVAEEETSGGH